jgi:hypothetical protein
MDYIRRRVPVTVASSEAETPQYQAERELKGLCLKSSLIHPQYARPLLSGYKVNRFN